MTLSLEMNLVVGAFVVKIARAAWTRSSGLAWKSDRGLRPWQMYEWVSWEPGRADVSLSQCAGLGIPGLSKPRRCREVPPCDEPVMGNKETEPGEGNHFPTERG